MIKNLYLLMRYQLCEISFSSDGWLTASKKIGVPENTPIQYHYIRYQHGWILANSTKKQQDFRQFKPLTLWRTRGIIITTNRTERVTETDQDQLLICSIWKYETERGESNGN